MLNKLVTGFNAKELTLEIAFKWFLGLRTAPIPLPNVLPALPKTKRSSALVFLYKGISAPMISLA